MSGAAPEGAGGAAAQSPWAHEPTWDLSKACCTCEHSVCGSYGVMGAYFILHSALASRLCYAPFNGAAYSVAHNGFSFCVRTAQR